MLKIVDFIPEGMKQGTTRPLLCRASDEQLYVVKNKRTSARGLISEYVAASLARRLNLPVPSFEILEVESLFADQSVHPDAKAMAILPSFGSLRIEQASEPTTSSLPHVAGDTKAWILLFDWWIANSDRRDWGENTPRWNPNLLWVSPKNELVVIDHNMAFDQWTIENPAHFWDSHIFRKAATLWTEQFRAISMQKLRVVADALPEIWNELPVAWTAVEPNLTMKVIQKMLSRFDADSVGFWRCP